MLCAIYVQQSTMKLCDTVSSEKENPSESLWPEQMSDKMSNKRVIFE
jgi:hypothetical protein